MLIQSYMRKKIGFERKFSLSVGRVPDLPSPEQAPDLHQYFQYFGLCFGIFPYAALCTFRHFSSLLCTFHARLFRRAPRPVYTSTERVMEGNATSYALFANNLLYMSGADSAGLVAGAKNDRA